MVQQKTEIQVVVSRNYSIVSVVSKSFYIQHFFLPFFPLLAHTASSCPVTVPPPVGYWDHVPVFILPHSCVLALVNLAQ